MTAKGHILLAITPLIAINPDLYNNPYLIGASALGAVLPDIDEPHSYIGKRLYLISDLLHYIGIKHRTITHSLYFPAIFFILGILFNNIYLLAIGYGALLHLIGDSLTITGVPLFYPNKTYFNLLPEPLRFKTNGSVEYLIILILIVIDFYILRDHLHIPDDLFYKIFYLINSFFEFLKTPLSM